MITKRLHWFNTENVVQHDTSKPNHNAFPALCVAANGSLVIAYAKTSSHTAFDGQVIIRKSSDGGHTWGREEVIFDYLTDGGGSVFWAIGGLTTLSDGRILLSVGKRPVGADGIGYFESNNNGTTWSSINRIMLTGFTSWAAEGGQICELSNGNLLFPFYGTSGSKHWSCGIAQSTDGGCTWKQLAICANGQIDGRQYAEPGLVEIGNLLYVIIRDNTTTSIRYATSRDNGTKWGKVMDAVKGSGRMNPVKLSTGEVLTAIRHTSTSDSPCALLHTDDGIVWQLGHEFRRSPNFTNAQMVYGQFAEMPDGTICIAYGQEAHGQDTADIMFAKTQ